MSLEVETIVAVSIMMAVFSAVAAIGSSIVLGVGFERLRSGFEVIRKQTGFFSDAIHKLEEKMEVVDEQTNKFSKSIEVMESKVSNVGDQANIFSGSIEKLEKKVDIVDKQAGFFGNALHRLEEKVEKTNDHEEMVAERLEQNADAEVISVGKTEALVSHAEDLLEQMGSMLAEKLAEEQSGATQEGQLPTDKSFAHYMQTPTTDSGGISYN